MASAEFFFSSFLEDFTLMIIYKYIYKKKKGGTTTAVQPVWYIYSGTSFKVVT